MQGKKGDFWHLGGHGPFVPLPKSTYELQIVELRADF